jgi:hypothetical protein
VEVIGLSFDPKSLKRSKVSDVRKKLVDNLEPAVQ